ncbi:MazG nucleotide pyrophosphohydrolase domain-containing protein [Haliangium ochraceum]|uniref:MazG nucleotide pyrophosphohydrolase n=1 Tax=Haliangium ochraceum (strain DSM 14365 / JCM 11303 / SMP-2) TaxID=502025 RepID=D0LWX7_HALO1|nr:MazG nucleotide pyrophosphohydrolase domain-containing protein [Haliangium ochraceum]ACY14224.1 MazG nucleotide pyrophosphohydrolase [Haliangium ochraceum DSM 14365]
MSSEQISGTVTICGSFRKHFEGILAVIEEFESHGIKVLSPKASPIVNPGEEFAVLRADGDADPKTLEQRHLDAISASDAVYFYNPDGYLGASATMELGFALAQDKPVYAKERPTDFTLKLFAEQVATPAEVAAGLRERGPQNRMQTISPRSSLHALQHYVHQVVVDRGFDDESPRDIMLLMVEEVGELAKALRKYIGLKIDADKADRYNTLQDELADVFIYLLDLASGCDIDLYEAFFAKESKNHKRFWKQA